jgi:hypothetical protein
VNFLVFLVWVEKGRMEGQGKFDLKWVREVCGFGKRLFVGILLEVPDKILEEIPLKIIPRNFQNLRTNFQENFLKQILINSHIVCNISNL